MKLYEIDGKLNALLEQALEQIESQGNANDLLPDIEALVMAKDEKLANCVGYIKNLKALQYAIDEEAKTLKTKSASLDNKIESLERYISFFVGGDKWTNGVHSISFRKSESVDITDETIVPAEFKEVVTTEKISKTKIKDFLKLNPENKVEGVVLVVKNNIQIK